MTAKSSHNPALARAIIASHLAPPFMFSGVAIALPQMDTELHAGGTALSLIETLFLAGSLSTMLSAGRLADAGDKRALYKLGMLGFAIFSLAIGLVSSIPIILGLRFLQGMSAAIFSATSAALLVDLVPAERRGRAFGASVGMAYVGLSLGPIVAGWLVEYIGWRAVFFFGAITLFASYAFINEKMPSKFDVPLRVLHKPSVMMVLVAVMMLVFGSSLVRTGTIGYLLLAGGFLIATIFVRYQRQLERPLLNVGALMANRVLHRALFVQMLVYFQAMASMFLLNFFMQISLGIDAKKTGPVLAIGSIVMAIVAPFAGRLSDRLPPRLLVSAGALSILVTGLMATQLTAASSLWYVRGLLAFQGLGFALFSSPNMTLIMNSVRQDKTSMASALAAKARSLGIMSGMLITSVLVSVFVGADKVADHPEAIVKIVTTAFGILAVTTALALVLCIFGRQKVESLAPMPGSDQTVASEA